MLRAHDVMPYHLGLESEDFDKDCSELIALGYEALFTPASVEVLGGRRICYFYKSERDPGLNRGPHDYESCALTS